MLLLIDNFDSFTYNISSAFEFLGKEVRIVREVVCTRGIEGIVIGPGPGHPDERYKDLILSGLPILGICLGHQMIGKIFGATVSRAKKVMHGKASPIFHNKKGLFEGLELGFLGMRYHSLALTDLPECLEVTARAEDGEVMGIRHRSLPIEGVQFHPDSIGTPSGLSIFRNYILKSLPR